VRKEKGVVVVVRRSEERKLGGVAMRLWMQFSADP
jgi:hypothetical protein